MQLIVVIALHVLSAVFWAGSTFALARTAGVVTDRLFIPQMGAAGVAVVSGGVLWQLLHGSAFGVAEEVLTVGALCAVVAVAAQGVLIGPVWRELKRTGAAVAAPVVRRVATAQRIAAGLLVITVICMAVVRFV